MFPCYTGYTGNNGPATAASLYIDDASLSAFGGICPDGAGGFYFVEPRCSACVLLSRLYSVMYIALRTFCGSNAVVRRVFANGTLVLIAGTTSVGYSGDGGPATNGKTSARVPSDSSRRMRLLSTFCSYADYAS